jgi:adenylate cyclase
MVAGGLPVPRADHTAAIAEMGLDMCDVVEIFRAETGIELAVRVGIDAGPVVAGVIGHRKFSYDVWGDTVNMASRMESHGLPSCIQVTAAVQQQLLGSYELRERGTIGIKGKGPTTTYLLIGRL